MTSIQGAFRFVVWACASSLVFAACGGSTETDTQMNVAGGGAAGAADSDGSQAGASGTSSGAGGSGGAGTGGGASLDASTAGSGGSGVTSSDAAETCQQLISDYEAALVEAKRCNPALNSLQCEATAPTSLPCGGCVTHVHDASMLTDIRSKWQAAGCKSGLCPAIACIQPGSGSCMLVDGGAGVCSSTGLLQ
jgi:hypothetical protein